MKDIVKICKIHGELTAEQVYTWNGKRTRIRNGKTYTCNNNVIKCRKCANRMTANWQNKDIPRRNKYQEHLRKIYPSRGRWGFIRRKYGLSQEDYENLFKEQNGVCAICKKEETTVEAMSKKLKPLSIDHCHTSGKNRGLLCNRCNPMIGLSLDSIETLQSAIDYLLRHK